MKKFKIKCISSLCLGLMFMSLFTMPCSANEIFYDDQPPYAAINLKWGEIVNGKAYLRINGDYLTSNYLSQLSTVCSAWNNVANKVTTVQTTFATSKIDMATASESYWKYRWGDKAEDTYGVCDKTSTDGYNLDTLAGAKASFTKEIGYAQIYFTPSDYIYVGDGHRRKTMVHEIGHALGLGHTNIYGLPGYTEAPAVMRQGAYEGYYTPQQHDIDAIKNKYTNY